ncbi:MAG: alpha/beta fold hydrolase [bacterium]
MDSKLKFVLISVAIMAAAVALFGSQPFLIAIFSRVLTVAIAAMGFNLLLGVTGQISIGHGAFMAIGAYTTAILSTKLGLPFVVSIVPVILFSALLGIVIGLPALRLKGFYLAIATLAFGVVVEQLIASIDFLGGHDGIRSIPAFFGSDLAGFFVVGTLYVILALAMYRILESPVGLRYRMVRDSEVASRAYGVRLSRVKLSAFIVSAVYGGIAGGLYAHTVGFIVPPNFGLVLSLNILAIVIIGGLASVHGGLIGSIVIVGLPFLFSRGFGPYLSVIVGALLIIFVLFFPRGLAHGVFLGYTKYLQVPLIALKNRLLRRNTMGGSYVDVDGTSIFYLERTPGQDTRPASAAASEAAASEAARSDAAPILYIHGNTGCNLWFERVMDIPGRRTIALDLPNFGRSARIDEADIDRYAACVAGFIRELDLGSPVVVAHSLGGAVGIALAVNHPELVSRLMLVDSAAPDGLTTPEEHYGVIELYRTSRSLMKKALAAVTPTLDDNAFLNRLADNAMLMNPIAFTGNARALERFDYTGRTQAYTGPVRVVVGRKDTIITEEMAKRTADAFPSGELVVLDEVGHSVMVEKPEEFVRLVSGFVE